MARYRENRNSQFVNPYNFVRVSKPEFAPVEDDNKHTGYIDCCITVKTPLAIPDVEKRTCIDTRNNHYEYPFMNVNGKYIIPGSSIRGDLRNIFEIATNSCMGTLKENTTVSSRVSNLDAFQPGLLRCIIEKDTKTGKRKEKWELYSAERYAILIKTKGYKDYFGVSDNEKFDMLNSRDKGKVISINESETVGYGDRVYFAVGNNHKEKAGVTIWENNAKKISKKPDEACKKSGFVYVGETFSAKKHAESIFVQNEKLTGDGYAENDIAEAVYGLEESLKVYQDEAINRNLKKGHSGYKSFQIAMDRVKDKGGILPVWYSKSINGYLYFSLAAIGRKQYRNTINTMSGDHCKDRKCLCRACNLFGMIPSGKANEDEVEEYKGKGSRIRITDAICVSGKLTDSSITLKELGKPRPSYLPFYATDGKPYDENGGSIRGRKFYWHIPEASKSKSVYQTNVKTERNASHFLMLPGAEFKFRIFYDGVNQKDLDDLLWCIALGDKDGSKQRYHHLGHGKPLGLGSVSIVAEKCVERKYEVDGYAVFDVSPRFGEAVVDERSQTISDLLAISEFLAVDGEKVSYPYVEVGDDASIVSLIDSKKAEGAVLKENVLANHQWFTQYRGRSRYDEKRTMPPIKSIADKTPGYDLHPYVIKELEDRDFAFPKSPHPGNKPYGKKYDDNYKGKKYNNGNRR